MVLFDSVYGAPYLSVPNSIPAHWAFFYMDIHILYLTLWPFSSVNVHRYFVVCLGWKLTRIFSSRNFSLFFFGLG